MFFFNHFIYFYVSLKRKSYFYKIKNSKCIFVKMRSKFDEGLIYKISFFKGRLIKSQFFEFHEFVLRYFFEVSENKNLFENLKYF